MPCGAHIVVCEAVATVADMRGVALFRTGGGNGFAPMVIGMAVGGHGAEVTSQFCVAHRAVDHHVKLPLFGTGRLHNVLPHIRTGRMAQGIGIVIPVVCIAAGAAVGGVALCLTGGGGHLDLVAVTQGGNGAGFAIAAGGAVAAFQTGLDAAGGIDHTPFCPETVTLGAHVGIHEGVTAGGAGMGGVALCLTGGGGHLDLVAVPQRINGAGLSVIAFAAGAALQTGFGATGGIDHTPFCPEAVTLGAHVGIHEGVTAAGAGMGGVALCLTGGGGHLDLVAVTQGGNGAGLGVIAFDAGAALQTGFGTTGCIDHMPSRPEAVAPCIHIGIHEADAAGGAGVGGIALFGTGRGSALGFPDMFPAQPLTFRRRPGNTAAVVLPDPRRPGGIVCGIIHRGRNLVEEDIVKCRCISPEAHFLQAGTVGKKTPSNVRHTFRDGDRCQIVVSGKRIFFDPAQALRQTDLRQITATEGIVFDGDEGIGQRHLGKIVRSAESTAADDGDALPDHHGLQPIAMLEGCGSHGSDAAGNGEGFQAVALTEGGGTNADQVVGQLHSGKAPAGRECGVLNGRHAPGDLNRNSVGAVDEGVIANGRHTLFHHDSLHCIPVSMPGNVVGLIIRIHIAAAGDGQHAFTVQSPVQFLAAGTVGGSGEHGIPGDMAPVVPHDRGRPGGVARRIPAVGSDLVEIIFRDSWCITVEIDIFQIRTIVNGLMPQRGDIGRDHKGGQTVAAVERQIANAGDRLRDLNRGQTGTAGEHTVSDLRQTGGQNDLPQTGTVIHIAQGGNTVREFDFFQIGAVAECAVSDGSDTVRNGNLAETAAGECIFLNRGNAVGQIDHRKIGTGIEGIFRNCGHTVGNADLRQGGAVAECAAADVAQTVIEGDLLQLTAAGKGPVADEGDVFVSGDRFQIGAIHE